MISIVVPAYNAENTIGKLLDSVVRSDGFEECEVLVVDDASNDGTGETVLRYPARLIRNKSNSGSAASRNAGVKEAKGEIVAFLDSDVVLREDTLPKLIDASSELAEGDALIGIYSKYPVNAGFIPEFKALLDYYHWLDAGGEVTSFEPRCAIMHKDAFERTGGFDESIGGADVEDYEFGYRLMKSKGRIFLDRSIQVDHHFPSGFSPLARNFFQRGSSWMRLFLKRRRFDNVATTKAAGLGCAFAFLSAVLAPAVFFSGWFGFFSVASFLLYLYFYGSFFGFVLGEKGYAFTLKALLLQYVLSIVLGASAVKGAFMHIFDRKVLS